MGKDQSDDLELDEYIEYNYIEGLGWNRLGLHLSKMVEVMEDHEVWQFNLERLPPQP